MKEKKHNETHIKTKQINASYEYNKQNLISEQILMN